MDSFTPWPPGFPAVCCKCPLARPFSGSLELPFPPSLIPSLPWRREVMGSGKEVYVHLGLGLSLEVASQHSPLQPPTHSRSASAVPPPPLLHSPPWGRGWATSLSPGSSAVPIPIPRHGGRWQLGALGACLFNELLPVSGENRAAGTALPAWGSARGVARLEKTHGELWVPAQQPSQGVGGW